MKEDAFENQLFSITTIILTKLQVKGLIYSGSASGFYYNELEADTGAEGSHWVKVEKQWLITNRHVVFNIVDGNEYLVDKLVFCLRKQTDSGIDWVPITVKKTDLEKILHIHGDSRIDVVAIDVTDLLSKIIFGNPSEGIMIPTALSDRNLPCNAKVTIDVTSDIVVASYPKGFYDTANKFPIVKSGIIASAWGFKFNGLPMFEIDAQLFPGSSGGLVISKPSNISVFNKQMHYSPDNKQFVFLGIYSGEYTWKEAVEYEPGKKREVSRSYGLGNVWYADLVQEIIHPPA